MHIIVTIPAEKKHKQLLEQTAPGHDFFYTDSKHLTDDIIKKADIIIGNPPAELLSAAENLKWLQLNSAGADVYCQKGILPPKTKLTNATGAYGLALSEYMLAALLSMQKKLHVYYDNQKKSLWQDEGPVTSIDGSTVLVLGLGDIGGSFARKVKALGAHVIGMRRRASTKPDYIDEMASMDELDQYLARADIVACSLPGTAATLHLLNAEKFALMKPGAYFINVGRGSAVVTEALCDALSKGQLAGAAVDVTDPEPLPPDHPMWHVPNLYITPHTSGQYHLAATLDNIVKIAASNLSAFLKGNELKNEVDFLTGYKK